VLRGQGVVTGLALGPAHVCGEALHDVAYVRLDESALPGELARLHAALAAAAASVTLLAREPSASSETTRAMLESVLAMLADPLLVTACERVIREQRTSAEWAVRETVDGIATRFAALSDPYLRERAADVRHVGERVLRALSGAARLRSHVAPGAVVVARDLGASDAVELMQGPIAALVLERGGPTSHTVLLARARGLPVVSGVADALQWAAHGAEIFVDAFRGELALEPGADERARVAAYLETRPSGAEAEQAPAPVSTRDGVAITLGANIAHTREIGAALREGAAGIALYRTEYLYLGMDRPPDEETQVRLYGEAARAVAPRPLVVRTFDLGGDKQPEVSRANGSPFGLRGLRLALRREQLFLTQLRAILRAAVVGDVRLLLPMVVGPADLRSARHFIERAIAELTREGRPHRRVPIGAMIEVPAVDRGDPQLAPLATAHDPAVLRLLAATARAAAARGIPLSMCGEMASDPRALPLALGLGYASFGIAIPQLATIRALVTALDVSELRVLVAEAMSLATADEVEAIVAARLGDTLCALAESRRRVSVRS
jgi:phosphotransferase system enzyme I (PtsI)